MVYEIALQTADPARRDEYIKVFGQALLDANYADSHGIKFFASVEPHTQHRGTPAHNRMREINSGYQTAKSEGAHYLVHEVRAEWRLAAPSVVARAAPARRQGRKIVYGHAQTRRCGPLVDTGE